MRIGNGLTRGREEVAGLHNQVDVGADRVTMEGMG